MKTISNLRIKFHESTCDLENLNGTQKTMLMLFGIKKCFEFQQFISQLNFKKKKVIKKNSKFR